ncbi:hypothetical protein XENOCAPTIV_016351 [Xenoophorus captivus]|uniref:Uncharacterized protein n=1 Tax=Xenoophorus captivus TaxID=1517983 RepID=A0ABV0Q626_9TELE
MGRPATAPVGCGPEREALCPFFRSSTLKLSPSMGLNCRLRTRGLLGNTQGFDLISKAHNEAIVPKFLKQTSFMLRQGSFFILTVSVFVCLFFCVFFLVFHSSFW